MIPRKTPQSDLERYRSIFFMLGLAISMGLVIIVLNLKFYDDPLDEVMRAPVVRVVNADEVPVTYRQPMGPPPPAVPSIEQIQVVNNDIVLDAELEIMDVETDEDEVIYFDGTVGEAGVTYVAYEDEISDEIMAFEVVESVPVFPGCESAKNNAERKACFQQQLMIYVSQEFNYPEIAAEMGIQGKVFVEFVIEKNGTVSHINVIRGVDPSLDLEAVRVVKGLPRISPATQRGKPVRMRFVVPISAKLHDI